MTLPSGSRLGSHEIIAKIGEGGMGEVYRATDIRLRRSVAIKVLPAALTTDRDRLIRFEREAQVLASLNHSNIAHIYGFETATLPGGSTGHFIAMELVEGEDLAERLKRGPLPVDEAIVIARQMADALEEAHERGIIHRDLKPANVKVTPDGKVKVLDFGLAKAIAAEGTIATADANVPQTSPTFTTPAMTAVGMILGTAAYMAPEQARGKPADKRADIWAFGAVLFEMLTGRRVFEGETVSDVMAATLRQSIDWHTLPEATPVRVRQLLRRCLERDPKQRLRDIGEARVALDDTSAAVGASPGLSAATHTSLGRTLAVTGLVAAASAAVAIWLWTWTRPEAAAVVTRLSIPLPPGQVLWGNGGPAISRDGRTIAYAARDGNGASRLYVRGLDRFETSVVPESEGAQAPFFSPDGTRVGFFARGKVLTAAIAGGAATPIADASAQPMGADWGDDDTIVFAPALSVGLLRVASSGGKVQQLTEPDESTHGYAHGRPQLLPGGRSVLFNIWSAPDTRGNVVVSMAGGEWTRVMSGIGTGRFARSGHFLVSGPRGVRAAPFDPDRPHAANAQTFVIDDVFWTIAWGDSWFSVSDTGTLVFVPGDSTMGRLAWVERDGRVIPLSEQPVSLVDPSLSPDGERIAMQDRDDVLWTMDLRRGTRVRLTLDGEGTNAYPVWSRDGTRVTFASNRTGDWEIYSAPAGGGSATRLLTRKGNQFPLSYAPDGTLLFNERFKGRKGADLWTLAPGGAMTAFLEDQPATKAGGQFSPDGRAVAYISDETGRDEIYLRPFGAKGDAVQVSTDGGGAPRWSPDGRELFFRRGDAFFAASVTSADGRIAVADPRKLFEVQAATGRSSFQPAYSPSPDGRRFLVHLQDPRAIPTQINVVLNWFTELRAKVPVR